MLIKAIEIQEVLGVSKASAYRIIQSLNHSLEKKGYRTVTGKTPRKYFYENYYLFSAMEVNQNVRLQR